jgi:hypothetical protein
MIEFYLRFEQFQSLNLYNSRMPDSKQIFDQTLMDIRRRCLSLAADLDRLDRSGRAGTDPRLRQFRDAFAVLLEPGPNRAERIQLIFSDKTPPPLRGKK